MDSNIIGGFYIGFFFLFLLNGNNNYYVVIGEGMSHHHGVPSQGLAFFPPNQLKLGKIMPIIPKVFVKDPSNTPQFLPKSEADLIPFSLSRLSYLLNYFGFSSNSLQAKSVEEALTNCETEPLQGEYKFCATSLESMLNVVEQVFGSATHFKAISSKPLENKKNSSDKKSELLSINEYYVENYTIMEEPRHVATPNAVLCHMVNYPYAIYHCHGMDNTQVALKVFQVSLKGESGIELELISVCHMDTSLWDPTHESFRVFEIEYGSPVCHFFPFYDMVWVPLSSTTDSI